MVICFLGSKLLFASQTERYSKPVESSQREALQAEPALNPFILHQLEEQRLIKELLSDDQGISDIRFRNNEKWRVVRMRVTGYCPCPSCCGSYSDGITASNHQINPGDTFAAADKSYAFGTKIVIPGYNESEPVEVLDRGGAIKGDRLDVFFHTHQQALEWGVQTLNVLIKAD